MRSRVNSVSVWFTIAMLMKVPLAVDWSISICSCTGGVTGLSGMSNPIPEYGPGIQGGSCRPGLGYHASMHQRRAPTRRTPLPRPAEALGRPFDLPGGPDAALLLHGLSGSPFELRALADRLYLEGIRCLGPLMAGHGGAPEALRDVLWTDWVAQGRDQLYRLQGARRTFVVGCSMGALVALALAHDHPDRVDGLALLAPALRLAPGPALGGLLARRTPLASVLPPLPKGTSDVRDDEMR